MSKDMMQMIQALSMLDENNPDIKDIIDTDVSELNDEIENERILKEVILSLKEFIPTAKSCAKHILSYINLLKQESSNEPPLLLYFVVWPSGKATDFDSVIVGSNPATTTIKSVDNKSRENAHFTNTYIL